MKLRCGTTPTVGMRVVWVDDSEPENVGRHGIVTELPCPTERGSTVHVVPVSGVWFHEGARTVYRWWYASRFVRVFSHQEDTA